MTNRNTTNLLLLILVLLVAALAVFGFTRTADDAGTAEIPPAGTLDPATGTPAGSASDTMTVVVYHYDAERDTVDGNVLCSDRGLVAVPHTIAATEAPLRAALDILLAGETAQPGLTPFPAGVELERVTVSDDGVATVVLDDPARRTSGGACRASILLAQFERTVRQFPHITEVRFEPEDLFQP